MAGFCRVSVVGWLSRDPESDYTPNGLLRMKLSIPVSRRYTDRSGQEQQNTAWYNVTVFGRSAENLMQLSEKGALAKGKQVFVEGRLEPRDWVDKEGKNRTSLDITADFVQLLGSRADDQGGGPGGSRGGSGAPFGDDEAPIDNVPF